MPKRVQMTRSRQWRDRHPDAVIVDRRSRWGNPHKIGDPGIPDARAAVDAHAAHLMSCTHHDPTGRESNAGNLMLSLAVLTDIRMHLRGRDLACWCRLCDRHADGLPLGETCPDCDPCHADVLLRVANEGDRE